MGSSFSSPFLRKLSSPSSRSITAASGILTVGLVGRVILPSFGMYLRAPWPYSAIQVSLLAFVTWVAIAGVVAGADIRAFLLSTSGALIVVGTCVAFGATLGVPFYLLPLPAVGALALCMYAEEFAALPWIGVMGAAGATMLWFVEHHFGFLDIDLGGISVKVLCWLFVGLADVSLACLGLLISGGAQRALGAALLLQAGGLMLLEEHLFSGRHQYLTEGMYPTWMVLATSALGVLAALRLAARSRIPHWALWGLICAYAGKLVMVVPTAGPSSVAPAVLSALAVTAPLLLYRRTAPGESDMSLPVAVAHAAAIVASAVNARYVVFDLVVFAVGSHPSEGLVLGALLIAIAGGLYPLVRRFFAHVAAVRKAVAVLFCVGALTAVLQPPTSVIGGAVCPRLPFGLCPRLWDDAHFPAHEADDAAIYGATDRAVQWPVWLLVAAVLMGLAAVPGGAPGSRGKRGVGPARATLAAAAAALVGLYVALQAAPDSGLLQLGVFAGSLTASGVVVLLHFPLASAPRALPWCFVAWAASLPGVVVLHWILPVTVDMPEVSRERVICAGKLLVRIGL